MKIKYINCINKNIVLGLIKWIFIFITMTTHFQTKAELYFNVDALHLLEEQSDANLALTQLDVPISNKYLVQVEVNNKNQGEYNLSFVNCKTGLCPKLTPKQLSLFGVNISAISTIKDHPVDAPLLDIEKYIPEMKIDYDRYQRILRLTFPPGLIDNQANNETSPEQWDDGLPMLFSTYSASGSEVRYRNNSSRSYNSTQYVSLRNGVNAGSWRLRNNSYFSRTASTGSYWRSLQTWLERDIRSLKARLLVGQASTSGLIYNSFSFNGISLVSEEMMQPDSLRGYAPEITGVAITHARVEIRQNGSLLYQTFVSPGGFSITDLYTTNSSGNLQVLIYEEDGTVRSFVQAFATPPIAIRKGAVKYAITVGEYDDHNNQIISSLKQKFIQAEIVYGLLDGTTIYGGGTVAEYYQSVTLGVGQSFGEIGALSFDITHANSRSQRDESKGQAYRLRYSKNFNTTGTNMTLAGYYYSTDGFYNFDEASDDYYYSGSYANYYYSNYQNTVKNRAQFILSQTIDELGALSLSIYQENYRGLGKNKSIVASWNKTFKDVTVSMSHSQNKNGITGKTENIFSLNLSIPLSHWLPLPDNYTMRLGQRWTRSSSGANNLSTTLSGTANENGQLSYSLSQAWNRRSNGNSANNSTVAVNWLGDRAAIDLGYSNYYGNSEHYNWGMKGTVVLHPYGVTLTRQLPEGSSYALIRIPGENNVSVVNGSGMKTDYRGYAIVPSLTPYRENDISLDLSTLNEQIDLLEPSQRKIPVKEALVLADYQPQLGYRLFLTIYHNGKPLPFGTVIHAPGFEGVTNEKGQLYLAGIPESILLKASLADGKVCTVPIEVKKLVVKKVNGLMVTTSTCY